jgi:hypothetical protein
MLNMSSEMDQAPQDLDWVTARAECTIRSMFKRLRREIEVDVTMRNKQLNQSQKASGANFSVKDEDDEAFAVLDDGLGRSVSFMIIGSGIKAIAVGQVAIEATIGMNDSGRCMLRVPKGDNSGKITGHCEIETWQFRKKTLESLFFPNASLVG